jgi:flagellar FliJ protein
MYLFKLQPLLNHRQHQEELLQKQLADVRRKLTLEQDRLHRKERAKQEHVHTLHQKQAVGCTVTDSLLYVNYIQQLSRDIEQQRQRVQQAEKKVRRKRRELIEAVKKRKTLEKLKEKGQQAYLEKQMHNERKFMDEIASTRHARRM